MTGMYHLSHLIARDLRPHDGIPGGPRISMPYSAATAGSGGTGPASARTNSSKPPGSVTSRKRASAEATSNV